MDDVCDTKAFLVKMEISKGWTHGCAFSWDQNLDFMFSSGHKKKIGKRHLSLTKFRLCGTCWQDSGVWNCDMTKFLHSQKCDNYYVFQYFNSSLGGSMGLSSYSGLIKHEWKLWCLYLSWLKIYPIGILCFQYFFCTIYDIYLSIPTMTINVVCSLLFAVGISLEFKVENFCLNNLFGPWTLNLDCQVYKCIIV